MGERTVDEQAGRMPVRSEAVEALEAERDFLLRSIADLDSERTAGELGDVRYRELRDGYTVQAATVLRALQQVEHRGDAVARQLGPSDAASAPRRRRRRRIAAVVLVAIAGGSLLARSVDQRQAGETMTGNSQAGGDSDVNIGDLEMAARQRPADPNAQLAYAFALLESGDHFNALKSFDTVARLDPSNAAAQAYGGWIVSLAGLTDDALARLDAAVVTDPTYPDAHFFRGMTLLRGRDDTAGALVELREFVRLAPPGPERTQVEAIIADLEKGVTSTTG